jgi:hypothetical protein
MSYKPQVFVQGEWAGNALVFATEPEAQVYGLDLMRRWTLVESYRTVESTDPVNYTYVDHELKETT